MNSSPRGARAKPIRHLIVVLGDQLDLDASAFDDFDPTQDMVWMAEVAEESTQVWSSKPRTAMFLASMRHFAVALKQAGRGLHYTKLDDDINHGTLATELNVAIDNMRPQALVMTVPGDWRVLQVLRGVAESKCLSLTVRDDRHFYCTVRDFAIYANERKQLRMEYFYREMRRKHRILMNSNQPSGGQWNFDADNRKSFGKAGPGTVPASANFAPDEITRDVITMVNRRFAKHPGSLASFAWPVTRETALQSLHRFISERLAQFGEWQDAMWPNKPWLWHSHLSALLNLKLLNPREVVNAVEAAWRGGYVPLASAEGFIRQILGWREYVRGIYWTNMPAYAEHNALDAHEPLPEFYWTGQTNMTCLADAITQTLEYGYAHHIQRLMVTGLYALLFAVEPKQVHAWYLAVYVDAVEWVELPNTIGMSQAADGGLMASKPYIASGKYIQRMSGGSLCARCCFKPAERIGENACPFTTLYWDFLMRHEAMLAANPRTVMQVRNLARVGADERNRIAARATAIRRGDLG